MLITTAVFSCFFIGFIHSFLGEKYILIRLFKRENLPHLFGDDVFTKRTLRFAWHLTTVAWFGFGIIIWLISNSKVNLGQNIMNIIGVVFLIHALVVLFFSKGRHLSWIVFGFISFVCFYVK